MKETIRLITFITVIVVLTLFTIGCLNSCAPIDSEVVTLPIEEDMVEVPTETEAMETAHLIEIVKYEIVKNFEDEDSIMCYLNWTNNSQETLSFNWSMVTMAYQDGVQLELTGVYDDSAAGKACNNAELSIRPGTTLDVGVMFKLRNLTSPIEIEFQEFLGSTGIIVAADIYNPNN